MIPPEFIPILASAKDYADIILKQPLHEFGGLLAESVGLWRLRNRVRVLEEAKKICERHKIKPEKIMPSILVPLLEEAGNVDDENLSDMFARLLAAHLDPKQQDAVHPAFAKVLGQMSPLDAKFLIWLDQELRQSTNRSMLIGQVAKDAYFKFSVSMPQAITVIENLTRLGLCDRRQIGRLKETRWNDDEIKTETYLFLTHFGKQFLSVCISDGTIPS